MQPTTTTVQTPAESLLSLLISTEKGDQHIFYIEKEAHFTTLFMVNHEGESPSEPMFRGPRLKLNRH